MGCTAEGVIFKSYFERRYLSLSYKIMNTSDRLKRQSLSNPISNIAIAAGYAAPRFQIGDSPVSQATLSKLATKVLRDPLLLHNLSDRVYELMQLDLQQQRERSGSYGGWY